MAGVRHPGAISTAGKAEIRRALQETQPAVAVARPRKIKDL